MVSRGRAETTGARTNQELVDLYEWLRRLSREATTAAGRRPVDLLRSAAEDRLGEEVGRRIEVGAPEIGDLDDVSAWAVGYLCDVAKQTTEQADPFDPDYSFAGYHPSIVGIRASITPLAAHPHVVLLIGERGAGKGQLMRAIQRASVGDAHGSGPMHLISLAATPADIAESELFGHEKGSFTGAASKRKGAFRFAMECGETLFLDDIGDCPGVVQTKLLSVLDDGLIRPVGSDTPVSIGRGGRRKLRIVAAIQPGSLSNLRADLLDRLWFAPVRLPPLRHRGLDVLLLADLAVDVASRETGARPRITREVRRQLLGGRWPGNVRDLISVVNRSVTERPRAKVLDPAALARALEIDEWRRRRVVEKGDESVSPLDGPAGFLTLREAKRRHVREALRRTGGNVSRAAKLLGMPRTTLQSRLDAMRQREERELQDGSPDRS